MTQLLVEFFFLDCTNIRQNNYPTCISSRSATQISNFTNTVNTENAGKMNVSVIVRASFSYFRTLTVLALNRTQLFPSS